MGFFLHTTPGSSCMSRRPVYCTADLRLYRHIPRDAVSDVCRGEGNHCHQAHVGHLATFGSLCELTPQSQGLLCSQVFFPVPSDRMKQGVGTTVEVLKSHLHHSHRPILLTKASKAAGH